jgi:L-ascorbate metabolism protein UlaG (beta-lactamase superfamily)
MDEVGVRFSVGPPGVKMKIQRYLHSCILIENKGHRLLIDPGAWIFIENKIKPDVFTGIDVIVFTHKHGDHFDKECLKTIIQNNPGVQIVGNSDTLDEIKEFPNTHLLENGEQEIKGFKVKGFFAEHADVGAPCPKNTAYIIDDLVLHPGDSLNSVILQHKVSVLAIPIAGPWQTRVDSMKFVKEFQPKFLIPIHDQHIKDFWTDIEYKTWQNKMQEQGMEFKALREPGEGFEI